MLPGAATIRSATSRWNISVSDRHQGGHGAAQPAQEQRGADIVGQVGDDVRAVADLGALVDRKRIGLDDPQLARISSCQLGERRDAAAVPLDRDHLAPASSKARVSPPGPGPTS